MLVSYKESIYYRYFTAIVHHINFKLWVTSRLELSLKVVNIITVHSYNPVKPQHY